MKTTHILRLATGLILIIAAGCDKENNTNDKIPLLTTIQISNISDTTAMCGGIVKTDRGSQVTARGVCWNTHPSPLLSNSTTSDGKGTGSFQSSLEGLLPNTTYYYRAYASNANGTGYGEEYSFKTTDIVANSFTDSRDGNLYRTVTIGNQVWMAENLKYLPEVHGFSLFITLGDLSQAAYGVMEYNDINLANALTHPYYKLYGAIYNWWAMKGDTTGNSSNPPHTRGVCPGGWHLPTDGEWKQLEMALGMSQTEADNINWRGNYVGSKLAGNNSLWNMGVLKDNSFFGSSGFNALPGGQRHLNTYSSVTGYNTSFWTATEYSVQTALIRSINTGQTQVFRNSD